MKLNELFTEADPSTLGKMNDKMRDVLSKVDADDKAQAQAVKDKAEAERQAKAKELGPEAMDKYVDMLKSHDWYYDYSDDHSVWRKGSDAHKQLRYMADILDPDHKIWDKYDPTKKKEDTSELDRIKQLSGLEETATAGATAAGNIASVANPRHAYAKIGKDGKGLPKAPQKKNKDGTAKNALDVDIGLMTGGAIKR